MRAETMRSLFGLEQFLAAQNFALGGNLPGLCLEQIQMDFMLLNLNFQFSSVRVQKAHK